MSGETKSFLFLTLLALAFTAGLTFASIELPRLLDAILSESINTPDVATGLNELSDYKTDLYLNYFHLRPIGYICLALIVVLIVVGFVTERSGWSAAGAVVLFLPVFGHFAATMFFLGGLGFLRLLWLPALDASFTLFRLGEIINAPHEILASVDSSIGLHLGSKISYGITGLGLLIFFLGTLTWFYARIQKRDVADFWVYRFSRHPQYLGWIIWSYGLLYLPGENIKLCYGLSNTLPWLLSTMIILAVAMLEELKMKRLYGESYESYRKRAPFLFPLPRVIAQVFNLPLRLTFKKEYPDRKREIVAVLAFYTCLCLGVSVFYGGLVRLSDGRREASAQQVEKLVRILREADNFGEKRRAAGELEKIGEPAMESLIALLNDRVSQLRAYSAGALGVIKSERVIAPLITLLHDSDSYVRSTAAASLGRTGSPLAIPSLVEAMRDPKKDVVSAAVRALGEVRHPDVVPHLIRALRDTTLGAAGPAAAALGELGAQEAVEPLIHCFEDMPTCPYDVVGEALWKLNSDRAADAWILGLKKGSWWYPRSACAAALGRIKSQKGIESLIGALKDESEQVRRAAVLALMEIGSEKPRGALEAVRADSDLEVRIYAAEALKRIGTIK